jgi:hypothetical protein
LAQVPDRLLIPDRDHDHALARKVGRAEFARRALLGFIVVGVIAMTVMQTVILVQVRGTQIQGTPTGDKLLRSAERIEDCTSPGGECYQRGVKNQADAVGSINRVIVLAAACSVGLPSQLTQREREVHIQACVIDGLATSPPPKEK